MRSQIQILADGREILLVHFSFEGQVVCVPNLQTPHSLPTRAEVWQRSDDPRAVTCSFCKATVAYQQALAELNAAIASRKAVV
jgi:hypothetical protein